MMETLKQFVESLTEEQVDFLYLVTRGDEANALTKRTIVLFDLMSAKEEFFKH